MLVGRAEELAVLLEAVEAAAEGSGQVMFLVGEAGVGKSRLAAAAAGAGQSRGMTVLRGRAVATGATVAYRPWAEAFLSALRDTTFPDRAELAPFRGALGRLVPAWRAADLSEPGESAVALGEGALRLLRTVGNGRGTLAILEDLHWADPDSVALVEYLADKLAGEPTLVIGTLRAEGAGPALRVAQQLHGRREAQLVTLRRLSEEEVRAMARACLGVTDPPAGVDELLTGYADGLPFFVEELLASLVSSGTLVRAEGGWQLCGVPRPSVPLTFGDTVRQRLSDLGRGGTRLLAGAALLGRHFDWTLLVTALEADEATVLDTLRQAIDAHLVEEDPGTGRFRFRHALSRDAALATLLSPERQVLARRLLAGVRERHPTLPGDWCQVVAGLAVQAGDPAQAAALLVEAGRRALAAGALETATDVAEQAGALADERGATALSATELLVTALASVGETDRAAAVGAQLLDRLEAAGAEPARRMATHLELARSAAAATDWAQARSHVDAARRLAHTTEPALVAHVEVVNAQVALGEHRPHEAARAADAALDAARRGERPMVVCEALEVLGRVARLTDWTRAEAYFTEALRTAEAAPLPLWRIRALGELGIQDVFTAGSTARLDLTRRLADDAGALVQAAHADLHLAVLHHLHHDIEEGLVAAERAEHAARRYRLGLLLPAVLSNRALLELGRGREDEAESLTEEALALAGGDPQVEANIRGLPRTLLGLVRGDRAAGRGELEQAVSVMPPASDAASGPFPDLLLLLRLLDDDLTSEQDDALAPADRIRHRLGEGFYQGARAVQTGRGGDADQATARFRDAEDAFAPMPGFLRLLRWLVAEPAWHDGWGDPVAWLRDAVVFFEGTGWTRLAASGRGLLRRFGAAPPSRRFAAFVPPALAALGITVREAEVLALVKEGLPNRAIADRLVLSVRTVEKHVERLLAKTGTSTRAELAVRSVRLFQQAP